MKREKFEYDLLQFNNERVDDDGTHRYAIVRFGVYQHGHSSQVLQNIDLQHAIRPILFNNPTLYSAVLSSCGGQTNW